MNGFLASRGFVLPVLIGPQWGDRSMGRGKRFITIPLSHLSTKLKIQPKKWKWKKKWKCDRTTMGRSEHGKGEEIHNNSPFSSFNKSENTTNKVKVEEEEKWKWKKQYQAIRRGRDSIPLSWSFNKIFTQLTVFATVNLRIFLNKGSNYLADSWWGNRSMGEKGDT